jgi:adenosine deaminase
MDYSTLPKVELHLHLDCSLSYDVVAAIKPSVTPEEYREKFIAPPKCIDLADYLTRAFHAVEHIQTEEQLRLVTLDLFDQLKADNVIYAEIRFGPILHTQKGLSPEQVVKAVIDATEEGVSRTGVQAGLIFSTLRNYTEEQSMQTVELVREFGGPGTRVFGFDIAADEAGYPIDNHIKAFQYAKKHGISRTAHAGEARGADSVWETLRHFEPSRIGHGVRSAEDPELLVHLRDQRIHLEVCPTSNVQTNVFDRIQDHNADLLYKSGVSLGINTDTRTISNVTLVDEYGVMEAVFGWGPEQLLKCNLEAVEHAFCPAQWKRDFRNWITTAWSR